MLATTILSPLSVSMLISIFSVEFLIFTQFSSEINYVISNSVYSYPVIPIYSTNRVGSLMRFPLMLTINKYPVSQITMSSKSVQNSLIFISTLATPSIRPFPNQQRLAVSKMLGAVMTLETVMILYFEAVSQYGFEKTLYVLLSDYLKCSAFVAAYHSELCAS